MSWAVMRYMGTGASVTIMLAFAVILLSAVLGMGLGVVRL